MNLTPTPKLSRASNSLDMDLESLATAATLLSIPLPEKRPKSLLPIGQMRCLQHKDFQLRQPVLHLGQLNYLRIQSQPRCEVACEERDYHSPGLPQHAIENLSLRLIF